MGRVRGLGPINRANYLGVSTSIPTVILIILVTLDSTIKLMLNSHQKQKGANKPVRTPTMKMDNFGIIFAFSREIFYVISRSNQLQNQQETDKHA